MMKRPSRSLLASGSREVPAPSTDLGQPSYCKQTLEPTQREAVQTVIKWSGTCSVENLECLVAGSKLSSEDATVFRDTCRRLSPRRLALCLAAEAVFDREVEARVQRLSGIATTTIGSAVFDARSDPSALSWPP